MTLLSEASPKLKGKILSDIGLTEKRLEDDVEILRTWLRKQPHLPQVQSDSVLKSFIVSMKSVERAKERIDNFYTSRTIAKEIFQNMDPFVFHDGLQQFICPGHTAQGERVFYMRVPFGMDPDAMEHISVVKRQILICLREAEYDPYISGTVAIYDLRGAKPSLLTRWNPSLHKTAVSCMQDAMPLRIKKVYVINVLPFVIKTYETLLKPFMKKKLVDRIQFLAIGEEDKLLTYLPKDCIPSDYGGAADSCQNLHDSWDKLLKRERDWCLSQSSIVVNEALRPAEAKTSKTEAYSIAGTFRTLSID